MAVRCVIRQLCPKCKKLFTVDKEPFRVRGEITRQIDCPSCVRQNFTGVALSKEFGKRKNGSKNV